MMTWRRLLGIGFLFIGFSAFWGEMSQADPLDNWHWRNPLPQGNHLSGISYGNGCYVAVGSHGSVLTEDGFLKQVSIGKLKAGGSKTKKLSYSLPSGGSASGKYVIAVIDADNILTEADESNNRTVYGPIL